MKSQYINRLEVCIPKGAEFNLNITAMPYVTSKTRNKIFVGNEDLQFTYNENEERVILHSSKGNGITIYMNPIYSKKLDLVLKNQSSCLNTVTLSNLKLESLELSDFYGLEIKNSTIRCIDFGKKIRKLSLENINYEYLGPKGTV